MSETLDLQALGVLMRRMQGELRAIGSKLDLLSRGRDRDAATFATRDDLRDVIEVLAAQLGDFDTRISSAVGQVAQHMESHSKALAEILGRLPPEGRSA
jgi:hypothetical protein